MPKIDIAALEVRSGSRYPDPFHLPCLAKTRRALGESAGLTQFGVNLLTLPPGAWSAQRHWHSHEDEFVWVVEGEVVMVTDEGEELLRPGDCAGFKAGVPNGHHLVNRSGADAVVLEVGTRDWKNDRCDYPDIDMQADEKGYLHRNGSRYPERATP
jgi:uncharacterized cupin superfamily protein